jgi:hypothetical protein
VEHHLGMGHGGRYGQTMFTKQVSGLVDSLDPPIVAAEAQQVERTRRKTCSRAESEFLCPSGAAAGTRARRTRTGTSQETEARSYELAG